jgi:hypothetical protein
MNRKLNIYSYPNFEMIIVMGSHRWCAPFSLNLIMKQWSGKKGTIKRETLRVYTKEKWQRDHYTKQSLHGESSTNSHDSWEIKNPGLLVYHHSNINSQLNNCEISMVDSVRSIWQNYFKRLEHEVDEKLGIDCHDGMPSSSTPRASFSYRI